nr:hypothetical protein [Tanacetum cinerariifolium]
MDQTGEVVVRTTAVATTTTLAVTTGILVMGVTREIGVSSSIDLSILVPSSPGVPLRATPTQFALLVDINTQESVIELLRFARSSVPVLDHRVLCFFRLVGFLGAAAGTAEEQEKNFQWGLCKSTLNHLMCILFTDVAQV